MGNTESTFSSRKSSASSLGVPDSPKKASLYQRSKSSLQFRKRSKSSVSDTNGPLSTSSGSDSSFNGPHPRHFLSPHYRHPSMDSSDGHSDISSHSHPHNDNNTTHSTLAGMPGGSLPEWAHHSRRCMDGRTRHTVESAPYMLPNDLTEADRLDAQHYLVRFVFKGNYNVKLEPEAPLRILDVATGTGVWALEMAHEFPKAEIHGVDISPIFPTEIKPSNCHFQLCNILDGLPFPDNHFDFIYQRLLVYALTPAQRKQVNTELLRVLKPEGFLQLVESDGIVYNPGPEMEKINKLSLDTSLLHGVDPREVQTMKAGLKSSGYTNVNTFNIALPVGHWGGKAGALSQQNMHGLATIWLKGELGQMDQEQCDAALARADVEVEQFQSYYKVWLVVGMKPRADRAGHGQTKAASLAA